MTRRRDPIESAIESALRPGRFIGSSQEAAFVNSLREEERDICF